MTTSVEYKGPSVHTRILTRKDFEGAGVEFPKDTQVKDMVWEAGDLRRPVKLDFDQKVVDSMIENVFSKDPAFKVVKDGEVAQEADPNAAGVNPDGSSKADGSGGSEALAAAIGGRPGAPR